MNEHELAYDCFVRGKPLPKQRLVCAHYRTKRTGFGKSYCVGCGALFAVVQ